MTTIHRMLGRNQTANLLAMQGMLRISGLMGIGMLSAVRKALDTYLLCLQHSTDYVKQFRVTDSPASLVSCYADTMTECVEKSWQDFRNSIQILLLTQDEALIWVARIDKALFRE